MAKLQTLGEFEFIDQLIKARAAAGQPFYQHPLALGIGDDAALFPPLSEGEQMVVATDMLVEGRHYFPNVDPQSLGHKVLAVNLSDLAAMGARPVGFTLAAGLREIDVAWLEAFTTGLFALAREHQCACVGGDTVRMPAQSPNVFSITVLGAIENGRALRRSCAAVGDAIWVSGQLGDAAYAVQRAVADQKLNWPTPRVALGRSLVGLAHAAIDISDGFQSEVMHLLRASPQALDAQISIDQLPLGAALTAAIAGGALTRDAALGFAATGGDEYELCFTAPESAQAALLQIATQSGLALTRVGQIIAGRKNQTPEIFWRDADHRPLDAAFAARLAASGFDHFRPQATT
jgi:thiamine-monophosphate kinase